MLFINVFIPYWFANSINKHPIFWHNMTKKNDDFNDLISSIVGLAVISAIPAIVAFVSNYRKRVSIISIILIILLCICNIFLVTQIH